VERSLYFAFASALAFALALVFALAFALLLALPLFLLLLVLRRHSERSEESPHFVFALALVVAFETGPGIKRPAKRPAKRHAFLSHGPPERPTPQKSIIHLTFT